MVFREAKKETKRLIAEMFELFHEQGKKLQLQKAWTYHKRRYKS